MAGNEELIAEVAKTEALLSHLEAEQEQARKRLAALRAELAAQGQAEPGIRVHLPETLPQPVPRSPEEKVRLFRQLFRGRADVFPTRFVSRKTGKPGYAPACTNKFVRGICELPKVKCGECPNQAFVPVDDATVLAHLQGRDVMGAYPLLKDENLLVLGGGLRQEHLEGRRPGVRGYVPAGRSSGLGGAIPLGRRRSCLVLLPGACPGRDRPEDGLLSHHGDHVPASRAEHGLLRPALPGQDTMPKGGFGNLIALPLQYGPREHGNTVFLDDQLRPLPGDAQWAYLAAVSKIDRRTVENRRRSGANRFRGWGAQGGVC